MTEPYGATVKDGALLAELAAREAGRRKHKNWQRVSALELIAVLKELGFASLFHRREDPMTDSPPLTAEAKLARDDLRAYLAGTYAAGLPEKACKSILEFADAMVAATRSVPVMTWPAAIAGIRTAGGTSDD